MNNQCPYCRKKPFENQGYLANHIMRAHRDKLQQLYTRNQLEKKTLRIFANKIEKLPKTINIPIEYLKFFIDVDAD